MAACPHINISDGVCTNCDQILEGAYFKQVDQFTDAHAYGTQRTYAFEADLAALTHIPGEVKQHVIVMLASAPRLIVRKDSRHRVLFAYIYLAYVSLGIPFDPRTLATSVGISSSKYTESLKLVSGIGSFQLPQTKTLVAPLVVISPVTYIPQLVEVVTRAYPGLSLDMNAIIADMERILEASPLLLEDVPYAIAAALVKIHVDRQRTRVIQYYKHVGITPASVKVHVEKVARALLVSPATAIE